MTKFTCQQMKDLIKEKYPSIASRRNVGIECYSKMKKEDLEKVCHRLGLIQQQQPKIQKQPEEEKQQPVDLEFDLMEKDPEDALENAIDMVTLSSILINRLETIVQEIGGKRKAAFRQKEQKANEKKNQKRRELINEINQQFPRANLQFQNIKNTNFIITHERKADYKQDKSDHRETNEEIHERIKLEYKQLQNKFERLDRFKDRIIKNYKDKGYNFQYIARANGKILTNVTASSLMNTGDFYNEDIAVATIGFKINMNTFGDSSRYQKTQERLIISPNTQTRCFPESVAHVLMLRKEQINKFTLIEDHRNISRQIINHLDIGDNGVTMDQINDYCQQNDIKIYKPDEKDITEPGICVVDSHCIFVSGKYEDVEEYSKNFNKKLYDNDTYIQNINVNDEGIIIKKKNKKDPQIQYIFIDFEWTYEHCGYVETDEETQRYYYCCSLLYNDEPIVLDGNDCAKKAVDKIIQFMDENQDKDFVLYAHNMFKADLPPIEGLLLKNFSKDYQDLGSAMSQIQKTFNRGKQKLMVQDTLNHWQMTLKEISDSYCSTSRKGECNHSIINISNWKQQWEEQNIEEYAANDVLILKEAFEKYNDIVMQKQGISIKKNNILTASSLALKIYLTKYMQPQSICQLTDDQDDFCRSAYSGGSCQMFYRGHMKNAQIMSIDVNSMYPAQMLKDMPVGPYRWIQFDSQTYTGQRIQHGIYNVIVTTKKTDNIPLLMLKIDGKATISKFENYECTITSIEMQELYRTGSHIVMKKALVSIKMGQPFTDYIQQTYDERCQLKKQMKLYEEGSDERTSLDAQQLLCKGSLNGTYGKLGQNKFQHISDNITTNDKEILKILKNGIMLSYEEINDRFLKYSAIVKTNNSANNVMVAAFITAYGRIQLNQMQKDIQDQGLQLLYSDTDSVYFNVPYQLDEKFSCPQLQIIADKWCHQTQLGKSKYEMYEDVKHHYADEGVFLSQKTYALKSNITGVEFLKGNGISSWMVKEKQLKRCQDNGNDKQIDFDDYIYCLGGKEFKYNQKQETRVKKLLFNTKEIDGEEQYVVSNRQDNVKVTYTTKTKACEYTQKIILKSGKCVPKKVIGMSTIEENINHLQDVGYVQFSKLDDIKNFVGIQDLDELVSKYICIRNQKNNQFTAFENLDEYKKFLSQVPDRTQYHEFRGKKQMLGFDIDVKGEQLDMIYCDGLEEDFEEENIIPALRELFDINDDIPYEIINRSRKDKISLHIRFQVYLNKFDLISMIKFPNQEFVPKHYHIYECIDSAIYNNQFRITQSDEYLYDPSSLCAAILGNKGQRIYSENMKKNKLIRQQQTKFYTKLDGIDLPKEILQNYTTGQVYNSGNTTTIRLKPNKNNQYVCPKHDRIHKNDNCIVYQIKKLDNKAKEFKIVCLKQ